MLVASNAFNIGLKKENGLIQGNAIPNLETKVISFLEINGRCMYFLSESMCQNRTYSTRCISIFLLHLDKMI